MRRSTVTHVAWSLLAWAALTGFAVAQDQSVAPGINERFLESRSFGEFVDQFEREGREIYDRRDDILKAVRRSSCGRSARRSSPAARWSSSTSNASKG